MNEYLTQMRAPVLRGGRAMVVCRGDGVSMQLWTCTDHDTMWPVGGASIVLAETEADAHLRLCDALRAKGLDPDAGFTLLAIPLDAPIAIVLRDGDY